MTASPESFRSRAGEEPRAAEGHSATALAAALHVVLGVQISDLATRWVAQSEKILLMDAGGSDRDGSGRDSEVAHDLVGALLGALTVSDDGSETAVSAGLRFGTEAFARGASLHHAAKAVDLLGAMVMYAMEKAAATIDVPEGTVIDGIRVARRLQSRTALVFLAMIRGYHQAHAESLRDGFRHLRHDLRNPLGTIKSVLALMDDDSVPVEARSNPSFRAIAKRNAQSLEEMITNRLGDTAAPLSATTGREVSVQTLANSVRRELRAEAKHREVTVELEPTDLRGRFDAAGLELLLRDTLHAALQESHPGDRIHLESRPHGEGQLEICLSHESDRALIGHRGALDRLTALANMVGASVTLSDQVVVSVPMHVSERGGSLATDRSVLRQPIGLSLAETPHDLRSTHEDDHGQASVL